MTDLKQFEEKLIKSLKAKDEVATSTLRLLISEVKNEQIAKGSELNSDEIDSIVKRAAKKRKESIEAYKKAGRDELAQKEEKELKVLDEYLPEQISEEEIEKVVEEVIKSSGASGLGDMGKVMGEAMGKLKGQADGNVVSKVVKTKLS